MLDDVEEARLAERLIAYDTSKDDGLRAAAEFVKGRLEQQGVRVEIDEAAKAAAKAAPVRPRPRPMRRRGGAGRGGG